MDYFDYKFYLDFYPDLRQAGINTERKARNHYNTYGKKEKRICNKHQITTNLDNAYKQIANDYKHFERTKTQEEELTILIRTSNRPGYFNECITSILEQAYENFKIIICYDKVESLKYLNKYKKHPKIHYFPISVNSNKRYKFNLYCNYLMDKVKSGWIIFLDDDDKFTHNKVLQMINNNIESNNTIYIWKFLRADMIVFPPNLNDIKLGEIDTTSICFHSKHKNLSQWGDEQYGDFAFYSKFINSFKKILINSIFTEIIDKSLIGNLGN